MEDLRLWQDEVITLQEISKPQEGKGQTEIETEESEDTELEVEDGNIKIEDEIVETEIEQPDTRVKEESKKIVTAAQQNKSIRLEWYKVSTEFVPEKYRLQYVYTNADARNEKKIFEWNEECKTIGIIPDEFQLIPEDIEQEKNEKQE